MARELDPFSWTMSGVQELNRDLLTVPAIQLAFITAATMKMLGFSVETVSGVDTSLMTKIEVENDNTQERSPV